MKLGYIYRLYNRVNMKSYVGRTFNIQDRKRRHLDTRSTSPALANAVQKYGKDDFVFEVLESDIPENILSKMEILNICFWNSKAPNGYNLTDGGDGMFNPSEETRRKIAKSNTGRTHSPETRKKMSDAKKGKPTWNKGKTGIYTAESRQQMSDSQKGIKNNNYGKPAWNRGKSLSAETRKRMSQSQMGQTPSNKGKRRVKKSSPLQLKLF